MLQPLGFAYVVSILASLAVAVTVDARPLFVLASPSRIPRPQARELAGGALEAILRLDAHGRSQTPEGGRDRSGAFRRRDDRPFPFSGSGLFAGVPGGNAHRVRGDRAGNEHCRVRRARAVGGTQDASPSRGGLDGASHGASRARRARPRRERRGDRRYLDQRSIPGRALRGSWTSSASTLPPFPEPTSRWVNRSGIVSTTCSPARALQSPSRSSGPICMSSAGSRKL